MPGITKVRTTTALLEDYSVTAQKVGSYAILESKLGSYGSLPAKRVPALDSSGLIGSLPSARIGSFPAARIWSGSINARRLPSLGNTGLIGTVPSARIGSFPAARVWSGTLGARRIPSLGDTGLVGTVPSARIGSFPASRVWSGSLGVARMPSLGDSGWIGSVRAVRVGSFDATKIYKGTVGGARIPALDALVGTVPAAKVAALAASKITTGSLGAARIPVGLASRFADAGADEITSKLDFRTTNMYRIQVEVTTSFTTTSTAYVDVTSVTVDAVIPFTATVMVHFKCSLLDNNTINDGAGLLLLEGATAIAEQTYQAFETASAGVGISMSVIRLTVSAATVTYKLQAHAITGGTARVYGANTNEGKAVLTVIAWAD